MITASELAEWKQAAQEMHLAPTWEQGLRLIEECERLHEILRAAISNLPRTVRVACPNCKETP